MRVVELLVAALMAPLGLALGIVAVLTLAPLPIPAMLSAFLLIVAVVALDMLIELRGAALWSAVPDWVHMRSRRARRVARNLFLLGFIAGAMILALVA